MEVLKPQPDSSCHMIIDIWSSRQRQSVLGLKVQFIDSAWTLRNKLLGFKHMPEEHSAANIRKRFSEQVRKFLQPRQVVLEA